MSSTLDELSAALERETEADDALRAAVAILARAPGAVWAGIAFLEEGDLVLGPAEGTPDEAHRCRAPVAFGGDQVGELRVDGDVDDALLERAAELVAPYVLIGWDTGGEAWVP
jgi:hypothetical protein